MLKLFRIFQGCFTVQLSRFFAVVLISSNFYIISLLLKFVNNFFYFFQSFDWSFVFLAVSVRQLYYIIIRPSICQQLFSFFYKIPHSGIFPPFPPKEQGQGFYLFLVVQSIISIPLKMSKSIKSVVMHLVVQINPSPEMQKSIKSVVM